MGKPDLSGAWQTELVIPGDSVLGENFQFAVPGDDPRTFSKYFWNILFFKPEEAPMRPEAADSDKSCDRDYYDLQLSAAQHPGGGHVRILSL